MNTSRPRTSQSQNVSRWLLGAFMVLAAVGHLTFQRAEFQAQVPEWIPLDKDFVVIASGVVELAFGLALLLWKKRSSWLGLALFFVAIFPGNVHQYRTGIDAFGLDTDSKRLARLFFQPLLIAWALWSTGAWRLLCSQLSNKNA